VDQDSIDSMDNEYRSV